jgi:biopolymer transport protein ExbB/TolQ
MMGVIFAMDVNALTKTLGDSVYGLLTINFLFGMYMVILVWRRLKQLRFRTNQAEENFESDLHAQLAARNYSAATELCDYDFRALPRLSLLAIANRTMKFAQLRQLVSETLQRDILSDLEYRLSWVVIVIKSGPLLGLFGTVLGMMAAFGRIGTGEKVQPHQIADEISIALICTAMGLGTAIPLGYVLAMLTIRVRLLQESLTSSLTRVLEHFRAES